ncbi:MAG: zinc-dependent metalloprotease [Planctomycetaceae bacterium]|jgi:hypothetical protein|nr:zinc-dependent metalloprotease [Planctomycetaceae bacterium]
MLKKILFTAFIGTAAIVYLADLSYSQTDGVIDAPPSPSPSRGVDVKVAQHTSAIAGIGAKKDDRPKPIKEVLPDAEKIDGLITLYRKKDRLLAEIKGSNLNTDYLIAIEIAKGSGSSVIGGYTYGGFGDDKLWQFRKVGDKIHVVRRNIKFKANPGTPEELAVDVAYSDNTVYSLPVVATGDGGGDVIDFSSIFLSDLPEIGGSIGSFSRDRSYWGPIKGFPNNIELRVVATYSGSRFSGRSGGASTSEGVTVTIHYSISKLQSAGYSARLADNRIGYFTTSHKNYSKNPDDNHFVRYINRWNLQKADPSASLSPPKKPVIFWISKTTPFRYRKAVRDGILEWNKAFEKIGFVNAIEVRQQADSDKWDAEDINYNTFRWITSEAHFAMGPSHVNPITGEILNADIIFDAGFVDSWRALFNKFIVDIIPPGTKKISEVELKNLLLKKSKQNANNHHNHNHELDGDDNHNHEKLGCHACSYANDRASQFALASLLFVLSDENNNENDSENNNEFNETTIYEINDETNEDDKNKSKKDEPKKDDAKKDDAKKDELKKDDAKKDEPKKDEPTKDARYDRRRFKSDGKKDDAKSSDKNDLQKKLDEAFERFILEGLKDVVMHEVGHTLGLRHNFKASSWLTLDEINNPKRSKEYGIAGSVMDYLPVNISPKGKPQGDYFMTTLGPYDYLAIEYGYKILPGGAEGEVKELRAIAARQAEKGNNYAPDEDLILYDDPLTNRRDLGRRPIDYARSATELYNQLLPQISNRAAKDGDSYKDVAGFFVTILSRRINADYFLALNVGGQYRNRDRRGDPGGRTPIQIVDAKTQRETVDYLCKTVFAPGSFSIPPDLYNKFGGEVWLEGRIRDESNINIQDLFLNSRLEILTTLIDPDTLTRINDAQFRVSGKEDVYTVEELFDSLVKSVYKELDTIGKGNFTNKKPAVDIQQRDLQNVFLIALSLYTLKDLDNKIDSSVQAIARNKLNELANKIKTVLDGEAKLDAGSRLHLENLQSKINKILQSVISTNL